MKRSKEQYDVVVCGGGLAGFCAAVAAARHGAKTCLIQNRPVFGGNSSSEIGVTPHGAAAFHAYARETGIISELLIEERSLNHAEVYENGWTNSVWDMVMYDMAVATENLTVHLNTNVGDVIINGGRRANGTAQAAESADMKLGYYHRPALNETPARLDAVIARVQNAELELTIEGKVFIDCTGDGLVADRAGCEWRMGSEGKAEFDEPHAPDEASTDTMGSSIHLRATDVGYPVSYKSPQWAMHYDDASFFYEQGRVPKEERGGFWWLEIGVPYHTIHDNETIRHELTRHALGVWDWMKNRDPIMKDRARNYALDWIGQVPGKRESRRIIGRYFVTEHDILNCTRFEDEIAFGGWFIDLHTPGGLLAETSEPSSAEGAYDTFSEYSVKSYCGPYGLPLRCCMAKDVNNLMMAGRNISSTHAALGTIRVMATTALLGQACGTAAAYSTKHGLDFDQIVTGQPIADIKQALLRDGCFLPNHANADDADLARAATVTASSTSKVQGAGPDSTGAHEGLAIWRDQPQYVIEKLENRKAQLIAMGPEGVERVSVCLSNSADEEQQVEARLYAVDHIWDYRVEAGEPIAATTLTVPMGDKQWIDWDVNLPSPSRVGHFLRIDLLSNKHLSWHMSQRIVPGHTGYYQIGENKYRRFGNGSTLSYRVHPPQTPFQPEQVITGVTRPHATTNLWRSDASQMLPQSLDLAWPSARTIGSIHLTFPGHLIREYHAYSPYYRDAQCAADYRIEARLGDEWQAIVEVADNYQRHRIHKLDAPVNTDALRVTVTRTHGDPAAAIYEVRCYN